jgi:hypothetical protein
VSVEKRTTHREKPSATSVVFVVGSTIEHLVVVVKNHSLVTPLMALLGNTWKITFLGTPR